MLNEVLTVSEVKVADDGAVMLAFKEIPLRQVDSDVGIELAGDCWWKAHCFRPLVTRTQSQDIAEHFGMDQYSREPIAPLDIPMLDEVGQ
ncbi:MAG TPA: hypothetical protein VFL97_01835 [Nitrococcus sp.]|nr:hypothetical protein [Nitrococcus sp.]